MTKHQSLQVRSLASLGETVEDISELTGVPLEEVIDKVERDHYTVIRRRITMAGKLTPGKRAQVVELLNQGKTHKEIAREVGISTATIGRIRREELKKEPAPEATGTSSSEVSDAPSEKNIPTHQSTTIPPESQEPKKRPSAVTMNERMRIIKTAAEQGVTIPAEIMKIILEV